jgi:Fur family ferric uptake transcriptional regulator
MLILHTLRSFPVHPTAVELYTKAREAMPSLSLGTVYRNLEMLTRSGEVLCLERAGTSRRFDGNTAAHGHVRCTGCGRVGDIVGALPDAVLDNIRSPGFDILGMEVEFTGLCSECRSKAERAGDASSSPNRRARAVDEGRPLVGQKHIAPQSRRACTARGHTPPVRLLEKRVSGKDARSVRLHEKRVAGEEASPGRSSEKTGGRRHAQMPGC